MAKLRMAHASTHGARKPHGPKWMYGVRIENRGSIGNVVTHALLRNFSELMFGIAEET